MGVSQAWCRLVLPAPSTSKACAPSQSTGCYCVNAEFCSTLPSGRDQTMVCCLPQGCVHLEVFRVCMCPLVYPATAVSNSFAACGLVRCPGLHTLICPCTQGLKHPSRGMSLVTLAGGEANRPQSSVLQRGRKGEPSHLVGSILLCSGPSPSENQPQWAWLLSIEGSAADHCASKLLKLLRGLQLAFPFFVLSLVAVSNPVLVAGCPQGL